MMPEGGPGPQAPDPGRPARNGSGADRSGADRSGARPRGVAPNGAGPNRVRPAVPPRVNGNGSSDGSNGSVGGASDGRVNGTRATGARAAGVPVRPVRADGSPVHGPPRSPAGRPGPAAVPPPRRPVRPDPGDDEPTEVHGALPAEALSVEAPPDEPLSDEPPPAPPSEASSMEFPGRHRRRAGRSPDSRPAAEYKAQAEAARNGKKLRPGRRRRENFWRELPLLIVVALLMTFLIQTFVAKVYVIPSGSMELTLNGCTGCNNDRVLVDKVTYRFTDPGPGDIVVFRGPDSWSSDENFVPTSDNALVNGLQQFGSLIGMAPPDEKDFVKRVIAVGGQTVQCCDSRDRVLVDGEPLDEPYIYLLPGTENRQDPFDAVTVPEGHLWMMGDSRNNSADSRAAGHGPVPVANVIGQARLIVLPLPRFGWLPSIDPQPSDAVGMADGAGVPLAMGLLGVFPLAVWRRRRTGRPETFLP